MEEKKWVRLEMALHFIDHEDPTKYQDMRDRVHLDEKWFSSHREGEIPPSP